MESLLPWIAALLLGLALGGLLAWLWAGSRVGIFKERLAAAEREAASAAALRQENEALKVQLAELKKEKEAEAAKLGWVERAQEQLREAFQALASQALQSNAEQFLRRSRDQLESLLTQLRGDWSTQKSELQNLVQPVEKSLTALDGHIRSLEQERKGAYEGLKEQIVSLKQAHDQLQTTTVTLVQALKSPTVRGRWGEVQLRRVVEMAGMVAHVDFVEQATTEGGRPDLVVRLPNEGILPVDAKTPMEAYLAAVESTNEEERRNKLAAHARAMRQRVTELGRRSYWDQFDRAPEFVVMFVPNDACLGAVFERDPQFLEDALVQKVLPTTPVTLLALLKAVAYGWQQQRIADNARLIAETGRELYDRIARFADHLDRTGKGLDVAVRSFNAAVGSLESRVLPQARRFRELGAATAELPSPDVVERQVRVPAAVEAEDDDS